MLDKLTPIQYSKEVKDFIHWLSLDENKQKTAKEKMNVFFLMLGVHPKSSHSALEVQHVVGLGLRELLAQIEETPAQALRLRQVNLTDPTQPTYNDLGDEDLKKIMNFFGTEVKIVNTGSVHAEEVKVGVMSIDTLDTSEARSQALRSVLKDHLGNYLESQKQSGILKLADPGHYSVVETSVVGNGNCGCAALAMHFAGQLNMKTMPITTDQAVAYKETADYHAKAQTSELANDKGSQGPLGQSEKLFEVAYASINGSSLLGDAEKKSLQAIVEEEKQAFYAAILDKPEVAPVLALDLLIKQVQEIKEDFVASRGTHEAFIAQQAEMFAFYAHQKQQQSQVSSDVNEAVAAR